MATQFVIQSSNPRAELNFELEDASLSDAIQSVFPMQTERMLLTWNGVYIPLGYKYDFSFMVDDVVELAAAMLAHPTGSRNIHWPASSFAAVWRIQWGSGRVVVDANWTHVVGGTEALLAASGSLSVPTDEFLAEWKRPLEIVADALQRGGYTQDQIPQLATLKKVVTGLPVYGQLYASTQPPAPTVRTNGAQ